MNLKLLDGATATSSAPTAATDGKDLGAKTFDDAILFLASTAGSGTMSCSVKIWLYHAVPAVWAPAGTHATDATRGIMNEGNSIGEVAADLLRHTERIDGLLHFDRIYAQVTAIGGTATAISLWILARNNSPA